MKLDRTLARDIRKLTEPVETAPVRTALRHAADRMSTPEVCRHFNEYLKELGRPVVACCLAATIYMRQDWLCKGSILWAAAVLNKWTHRPDDLSPYAIRDDLHPSRIEEYARSFIRLTTEEY